MSHWYHIKFTARFKQQYFDNNVPCPASWIYLHCFVFSSCQWRWHQPSFFFLFYQCILPLLFFVILYPDLILSSCSGGCTLQQLSVMLTQFKLFDKLDRSNFPISLWKQKGNSCFILTTIQVNERKSRSLSPLEWKILLIIFWKVIFDILKTFCHNTLLIISIFLFDFTLITSWIVKE